MKIINLLINWSFDKQHIDVLFILEGRTLSAKRKTPQEAQAWLYQAFDLYKDYTFQVLGDSDDSAVLVVFPD